MSLKSSLPIIFFSSKTDWSFIFIPFPWIALLASLFDETILLKERSSKILIPLFNSDLFNFLEVNVTETLKDYKEYNVSGYPRNIFIHNFLNKDNTIKMLIKPIFKNVLPRKTIQQFISIIKNSNLKKIAMKKDTRKRLEIIFKNDIKKLSNLIGKDLSQWQWL